MCIHTLLFKSKTKYSTLHTWSDLSVYVFKGLAKKIYLSCYDFCSVCLTTWVSHIDMLVVM